MENEEEHQTNQWHLWFAQFLEYLLSPVGIIVQSEVPVSGKIDILLLQRENGQWTDEQLARLPDGVRDSQAARILMEFKYTESLNREIILQTLGYETFYKRNKELNDGDVQTFLVTAKHPQTDTRKKLGYQDTKQAGVYKHPQWPLSLVTLISLNKLSNKPHNMWVKCFATHHAQRKKAFEYLKKFGGQFMTKPFKWFIAGLWEYWFKLKGEEMDITLTPKELSEMGKMWLPILTAEERLAGLSAPERLTGLSAPERLAGLSAPEVLANFKPDERLAGLSASEIEAYLNQLKKSEKQN